MRYIWPEKGQIHKVPDGLKPTATAPSTTQPRPTPDGGLKDLPPVPPSQIPQPNPPLN